MVDLNSLSTSNRLQQAHSYQQVEEKHGKSRVDNDSINLSIHYSSIIMRFRKKSSLLGTHAEIYNVASFDVT